jgi:cation diffusion facilitator CzcD-associated flavoprotein CzcO
VRDDERRTIYEAAWARGGLRFRAAFSDLLTSKEANDTASEFIRAKIRETVRDPATAEKLVPYDHPFATKRPPIDTDYFETYNRDNVTLVDIRHAPIEEITPTGIRTTDGEYELDVIVFATGFDAMTGAFLAVDIKGKDGQSLQQKWADGPNSYLGVSTVGFPNLFTITGPGSPSVLSNMVVSIEQHVDWIGDLLAYMAEKELAAVEPTEEAEKEWSNHVQECGDATLFTQTDSWYMGANVPGKPRVFMPYVGGVGVYRQKCDEVAANDYEGFALQR